MIFSRKNTNAEKPINHDEVVSCKTCKCLLMKSNAPKVDILGRFHSIEYFCEVHKPAYQERFLFINCGTFFGRVQMDEDGTPVGYKKIVGKLKN